MPEKDVILEANGLRVVFFRTGDRYAHRVETFDAASNQWHTTLESLEGEPGDEWPPSPPFQQLHVERRPTGLIIFLIGMAGRTHWSAAVEASADRQSIQFDVAARVQLTAKQIGSEYVQATSAQAVRAADGAEIRMVGSSRSHDGGSRIEPTAPAESPATIAWKYAFHR